jgi:AcrR family transcriptional regulator
MARNYEQRLRADGVEVTKRRVLDALYAALAEAPAQEVSISEIASRAGVVRSTIYVAFGDRAGLFDEFGADVLARGGFADLLAAADDPDPIAALRGTIANSVRIYSQHRDVLRALYSRSRLDPDAYAGAVARLEAGRHHGMTEIARRLEREHVLPSAITADHAIDVLWLLTAFDTFDLLSTGRSHPIELVESALWELARSALISDDGTR